MPQNEDEFDAGKNPWPQPAPLPYPARIEEELSVTQDSSYRVREAYKTQENRRAWTLIRADM
jgi:hypothetical protein